MILDPVDLLTDLVAIPSVNPMGTDRSGPPFLESRLTDHLQQILSDLGLATYRQSVATNGENPERENLIGRLDGDVSPDSDGQLLLLDAHQDTVPVEGMTIDPFGAQIRDGRLYGRGACDVKGGMAAILAAVSRLAEERPRGMPTLLVVLTVNEESGFTGVEALTRLWTEARLWTDQPAAEQPGAIISRCPDMAVVAEPTCLDVVVAHKGVIRWTCRTTGRAAHSAQPDQGQNAIYRMAKVLRAIERYADECSTRPGSHPLCGSPTVSVGTIRGGEGVNTVPDRCSIQIDYRVPPGENVDEARQDLIDCLADTADLDFPIEHDPPFLRGPSLSDETNGRCADLLLRVVAEQSVDCRRMGVPYATHAAFYSAANVPSVVFGPGSIKQAHTEDEWVSLDQLRQAAEIYYRFVCSLSRPTV